MEPGGISTFEATVIEGDITRRTMISTEYSPADTRCLKVILSNAFYNFVGCVWMLIFCRNDGGYCISYRERSLEQVLVTDQEARLVRAMTKLLQHFINNLDVWNQYVAGT